MYVAVPNPTTKLVARTPGQRHSEAFFDSHYVSVIVGSIEVAAIV